MQYRFRDYSPALGRFLQRDPIGYWGGLNLYEYAGGDPVGWVDPLGWDRVVRRGSGVYWETRGYAPLAIGQYDEPNRVKLRDRFCGGCPTLDELQGLAEPLFAGTYGGHLTWWEHRDVVEAILCGRARSNQVPSSTDAWLWGFSEGVDKSLHSPNYQKCYWACMFDATVNNVANPTGTTVHILDGGFLKVQKAQDLPHSFVPFVWGGEWATRQGVIGDRAHQIAKRAEVLLRRRGRVPGSRFTVKWQGKQTGALRSIKTWKALKIGAGVLAWVNTALDAKACSEKCMRHLEL